VTENLKAMQAEIDRLKTQPVDEATLRKVQTKARAGIIRSLDSNSGLAGQLAYYYTNFGDWRELFHQLQEIKAVTPADIQRVARTYFTDENETTAWLAQSRPAAPASTQEVH
jgi:predicted Zn-dependent peptidase